MGRSHQSNREFSVYRVLRVSLQNYSKVLRVSLIEPREFYVYLYHLWNRKSSMFIVLEMFRVLDLCCDYERCGFISTTVESYK